MEAPGAEGRVVSLAVLLMAYGSPSRLEDVAAYLSDVRGGRPVRQEAVDELVEKYRRIGLSPLDRITEAQRAALEQSLGISVLRGHEALEAMDRGHGRAHARRRRLEDRGVVLAPHYSQLSVGSATATASRRRWTAGRRSTSSRAGTNLSPYIDVVAERVRGTAAHVVFTAHSLPERILAPGDPYRDELLATARLIAARAGLSRWSFAFQSESATGEPWLGPDIGVRLEKLYARGVREVLLAPIGFVSDHLEILWDLDVVARQEADQLGVELDRIESLNDDPTFIDALAELVRTRVG